MYQDSKFDQLFSYIDNIYRLPDQFKSDLLERLHYKKYGKKELVLREGDINQYIYFVNSGTLRAFYEKNGEEVSSWFMTSGDFIISVYSFFTRNPSFEIIETIKETELVYLHFEDLNFLYEKYLEFNIVGRKITEHYYMKSEERILGLRKQKTQDRYEFLVEKYPYILEEIPAKFIASYLGMTTETLSRIRNKI
ncbi:Crp/Fnr family transcriptional regulator [Chitinophaga sp. sic0106]|uniref:Crp/Fnr family transcriptional regulator n=1 Tax=Chitinophaga sp. sic0106 TaxID=2854785 RepID=UPI001C47FA27|nr:Crp/Fnr family transcriptional regulator [Chitinophaga sp. sic0106]MBV7530998.1 Crp/Fnr family transcriptional regulator [Chitinophaga sp. sic0106]